METKPKIRSIDPSAAFSQSGSKPNMLLAGIIVGMLILGIASGYGISRVKGTAPQDKNSTAGSDISDAAAVETAGIKDEETFKDKAEGILQEGGIEGEGAYHLERPGGESQTAYLTSTTVDLAPFIGKKVRVWGKTFQGEKAGWLMDVGFVELLK